MSLLACIHIFTVIRLERDMSKDDEPYRSIFDVNAESLEQRAITIDALTDMSKELAYIIYKLMEGEFVANALNKLYKYGYVDENHEWIYGEDL